MKIGYGNYGMPHTPWPEMVQVVAAIGYDGLELCVGADYPTAPEHLTATDRRNLGDSLARNNLDLGPLMVSGVNVIEPANTRHEASLDRLRRIVALGHDLGLKRTVVVSTLGGKTNEWESARQLLGERVSDWARVAAEEGGFFAFEPHVGGIVDSPDRARWLLEAVGNSGLKVNFDYSHFELKDVPLQKAMTELLSDAAGIHVKDVIGRPPSFRFVLPGEGTLDYVDYLKRLSTTGYTNHVTVEISGMVFNAANYDPVAAARFSYETLARAFTVASIERR